MKLPSLIYFFKSRGMEGSPLPLLLPLNQTMAGGSRWTINITW